MAAALATAACGVLDPGPPSPPCPDVAVLAAGERLVLFKSGPGRDLTDVVVEARVSDLTSVCGYDDGRVEVETSFDIVSTRGPTAETGDAAVPFFAAVMDPDGRVIAKETFESRAEFPTGRRKVAVRETVTQRIPLSRPDRGQHYQVLIGFQLTPEQLEYNEARR